ncbi:MAG: IclR family transcriptional regulator [Gammaproteobacteria bacterium]|nr:IclR family transcriptional regulator [Gammaproteobacteria bacterium]
MDNKLHSSIQVVDRAVFLLDALSQYDHPVSLKFLAADTLLHPSTAFRILGALVTHGLVEKDKLGDYRLGTRLLGWGDRVRSRLDLRVEARPIMEWLRDAVGETVNLTLQEGDEVVYVERMVGRRAIRVEQVIGSRAPLHVTAVGKLMLGDMGEQAWNDYAERTGLPMFTDNTVGTREQLGEQIRAAMRNGYALDNEEAELGVGCIGVVVRDASAAVVAGLSISAPIERRSDEWIALVQQAGQRLSAQLGYRG